MKDKQLVTLCRRIWRVKASKQSFVMNQNFVLLPSVSENFTATSPTPFRWVQTARVAAEMGRN